MPRYTFHPRRSDGCAATSLYAELDNDQAAFAYAKGALAAHPSAQSLTVVEGERQLWILPSDRARLSGDVRMFTESRACIAASRELLEQTARAAAATKG